MGRSPCCVKEGLNRGAWTAMEDKILMEYIKVHGEGRWRNLPRRAGLKRCGKSCRLRWLNYLRPDIKRGNIAPDEEELIIRLHKLLGNRWSLIAGRLPGRTDNEIKNYWNTNLSKRANQPYQAPSPVMAHQKKPRNDHKNKRVRTTNELTSATQPTESNVVRTKAVRCTKVFINPRPQSAVLPSTGDHANNIANNIVPHASSGNSGGDSWFDHNCSAGLDHEYNKMPSDFGINDYANIEDLSLVSEFLNSDFSEGFYCSNESNNNANNLSPNSPEQPLVFSQDMLEDWLGDQQILEFGYRQIPL